MSPWLDAVVRFGLPLVGLYCVYRALWPILLRYLDRLESSAKVSEDKATAAQLKVDEMAKQHYQWAQEVIKETHVLIGKYNEANAETVRQLQRLTEEKR